MLQNQLDPVTQNSSSIEIFKRALLKFIHPKPTNIYIKFTSDED